MIELQEWEPFKFKNFEITIIPCDESNNQEIDTFINYDLDTSILIYDKKSKTCFYNNVDNPCSLNILKKVKNISKKRYKKIDIASFAPRPASEYPQNFINLTNNQKNKFKNLIIKRTLNNAFDKCNKLSIKNIFRQEEILYCMANIIKCKNMLHIQVLLKWIIFS